MKKHFDQHVSVEAVDTPTEVRGAKGGQPKQYVPVEQPDNLRSIAVAKVLVALGEGEFQGTPQAKDIYLDDTPLADSMGNLNFPNVKWEYRSGSQDQEYIQGFPAVESGSILSHELRTDNPYIRAISDTRLSAVRIRLQWPQLTQQKSNGDLVGSSMSYAIDISTDGGSYVEAATGSVSGKTTSGYERSIRVDLPEATSGWQIRVRRTTADSTSATNINTTFVTGYTEIIDAKLRYPNTALLFVQFDAEQFRSIPKISVRVKGRAWPVPQNYDPETRTYSGIWDGTFKQAWTDNPVWIGYGLLIHERFGLGKRIKANMIDKWELYRISQYCDQLVPDGKGGLEPRFTCNVYIQSRAEAWTVLRDIAAIYRGMTYWAQSQMSFIADMPRDVDYVFTRANVIDGKFVYSGSSERTVYTRAIIAYDNPDNMYNSDAAAVYDQALQRRYGDNLLEITAIGCTSQSEAQRRGKWALYTNSKNRSVTFQVGLDGNIPLPGYVIGVADPLLAGRPIGGRIRSVNSARSVVLDRESQAKVGDTLILNLPSGKSQGRTINSVTDNGRVLGVTTAFSKLPEAQAQWSIDAKDLVIQQFRVTKITKDEPHLITIQAVYHDPNKYDFVDTGARVEDRPITVIPPSVQAPPTNVRITANTAVEQTMAVTTMTISWEAPQNAVYYSVEWRKDDGEWVTIPRVGATSVDIQGVYSGQYLARVRAYNSIDVGSVFASSVLTNVVGKTGSPPLVQNLTTTSKVFGIDLRWNFPTGALDTNYTEIQYNTSSVEDGKQLLLGTFAYPLNTYSQNGLAAGVRFYYRARLVDKTGNIGPWTTWVVGQSSDQATEILDYLTGQITETQLGQNLIERIDLIDGIGVGSVNDRIDILADDINGKLSIVDSKFTTVEGQISDVNSRVDDLQLEVDSIVDALLYDPAATYVSGDIVRVGDRLYQAKGNVPINSTPPNTTYWSDVGAVIDSVGAIAAQVTTNTTNISNIDGVVTAQATQLNALRAGVRPERADSEKADAIASWQSLANFSQQVTVEATREEATVERFTVLDATVATTNGRITIEEKARADADSALSSQITTLQANVGDNASAIVNEATVRATADSALSSQITTLTSTVNDNTSAIQTEATARANADSALATQINTVQATANSKNRTYRQGTAPSTGLVAGDLWYNTSDNNKLSRWDGSSWLTTDDARIAQNAAAIQTEATARANADSALATQINTVAATANGNTAAIQAEATARVDGDKALSSQITTVQATANSKNRVYRQSSAPTTELVVGDLWYNTSAGNAVSRWSGSAWVATDDTRISQNAAAIQTEATARADADSALTTQVNLAQSTANGKNKVYRQSTAPTNDPVGTLVTGDLWFDTANSNIVNGWSGSAWVATDDTRISENTAAILTEATTRANADSALSSQLNVIQAGVRPQRADGEKADSLRGWQSLAQYSQQVTTVATNDEASVQRDTLLSASVADTNARLLVEETTRATADSALASQITTLISTVDSNTAAIQTESTARANADSALSSQVTTAQATANGATATAQTALTTSSDLQTGLNAMWSVKLQLNQNGQYVYAGVGLGISNEAGQLQSNFIVRADQFSILNNQPDGTVTSPFTVSGGQTFINQAFIAEGSITNAKIGNVIQSTNWNPTARTGWQLNKDGNFTIYGSVPGQGSMEITNRAIKVRDNNGTVRVQMGDLTA